MAKTKEGDIVPWNPAGSSWVDGSVEKYSLALLQFPLLKATSQHPPSLPK